MTISARVQQQFFAGEPTQPTTAAQLMQQQQQKHQHQQSARELIRLPPTVVVQYKCKDAAGAKQKTSRPSARPTNRRTNLWTVEEHERFLQGLTMFPQGPWKEVAAVVATKSARQTMTHAQKYRQKIERRAKGLRCGRGAAAINRVASPLAIEAHPVQEMISLKQENEDKGIIESMVATSSTINSPIDTTASLFDEVFDDSFFFSQGLDALIEDMDMNSMPYTSFAFAF